MAFNAFLQIGDIKGESTDKDHSDWIDVLSYSHSISQNVSVVPSGGGSGAGVTRQDFVVTKHIDSASPKLFEACATGKHYPGAVLEVTRSGGKPVKFLVISMKDVIVSSVASSGLGLSGSDLPIETVSLVYGSIQWSYTQQMPDGSIGGVVTGTWTGRSI